MSEDKPYRSGPVQKVIRLGEDIGDFIVRLFWTADENDSVHWVDFELIEICGFDVEGGPSAPWPRGDTRTREFYQRRDAVSSPDPVYTLDEAEWKAQGFVKWDGCTQFDMDVHVDSRDQLSTLLAAVLATRQLCAEAMPGMDIQLEYPTEGAT